MQEFNQVLDEAEATISRHGLFALSSIANAIGGAIEEINPIDQGAYVDRGRELLEGLLAEYRGVMPKGGDREPVNRDPQLAAVARMNSILEGIVERQFSGKIDSLEASLAERDEQIASLHAQLAAKESVLITKEDPGDEGEGNDTPNGDDDSKTAVVVPQDDGSLVATSDISEGAAVAIDNAQGDGDSSIDAPHGVDDDGRPFDAMPDTIADPSESDQDGAEATEEDSSSG